jgi:predicted protein tyrosine phosphatase
MKAKVLCVCTMGQNRSKYVSEYLSKLGYETRYGGVGPCKYDPEPVNPLKSQDIDWADVVIVMREKHIKQLKEIYGVNDKRIINLEVSDSQRLASEKDEKYSEMTREEFNKSWTYPQLEKELEKYLPLEV